MSETAGPSTLDDLFKTKTKVAFKALGGRAKVVYWHFGVAKALETLGYRFAGGLRAPGEARPYGPTILNPLIGSSAGALFACLVAASDKTIDEVAKVRAPAELVFQRTPVDLKSYFRRIRNHTEYRTGRKFRLADLRLIDFAAITARYTVQGLERFIRESVTRDGNRFEDLRTELYILATELDKPRTVVFGGKTSEQLNDYIYQNGVSVSEAAACSMSLPPIYAPAVVSRDGKPTYYIDGELRDPYTTNVAEDSGADLVFVSSVYQAYQFSDAFGSLFNIGMLGIYPQSRDQSMDAKKQIAIYNRRKIDQAIAAVQAFSDRLLSPEQRETLIHLLEIHLEYRRRNTIIYIAPFRDLELYRIDPFDLSEATKRLVMLKGYDRTFQVLQERGLLKRSTQTVFAPAPQPSAG